MTGHLCIDCVMLGPKAPIRPRKIANPGQTPARCATHLRAFKTRQRKQKRARQIERTYDITEADNHELFLFQGGRCWLCRKATGATKSLAVDHDHATNEVRGRLCGPCNQFIGKLGDDPEAARRLVAYLTGDTPYRRLKAQQLLESLNATVHRVTVHNIQSRGDELYAAWTLEADPKIPFLSLVRRDDGVWSVTRD
jgi:hypothetical protein